MFLIVIFIINFNLINYFQFKYLFVDINYFIDLIIALIYLKILKIIDLNFKFINLLFC
jgi:hypothetical protein